MEPNDISAVLTELEGVRESAGSAVPAALALAVVYGLTRLTKLPSIDRLLGYRKWLRVVVAVVLGVLTGVLQALTAHRPWAAVAWAAVTGSLAGLGAVGLDQAISWLKPSTRQRDDIVTGIEHTIQAKDAEVTARVATAKSELEAASTMASPAERRKSLAEWGRRYMGVRS